MNAQNSQPTSQAYLRNLLIPAQCTLSSPVLRTLAIHLSDALERAETVTEEMCEEAIQVMLIANTKTDCSDLSACLKRLSESGWQFSQGDSG